LIFTGASIDEGMGIAYVGIFLAGNQSSTLLEERGCEASARANAIETEILFSFLESL